MHSQDPWLGAPRIIERPLTPELLILSGPVVPLPIQAKILCS